MLDCRESGQELVVEVGKSWERTGRMIGCMVLCTGVDEDRLDSR